MQAAPATEEREREVPEGFAPRKGRAQQRSEFMDINQVSIQDVAPLSHKANVVSAELAKALNPAQS